MSTPRTLVLALAVSGSLLAQTNNDIGFTKGWATSFTTRVGANAIDADLLNHYDSRNYTDWMLDPADTTGSTYKFNGLRFVIQDQIGTTPETFEVVAYNEDPANANFPDPAATWVTTASFSLPTSTVTTAVAWVYTITMTSTSVPKGDKWIGVRLHPPTGNTWPTDGTSLHATYDRAVNSTSTNVTDQAGPRIDTVPNGQFSCFMAVPGGVPTGPAVYGGSTAGARRELNYEIIANTTGGVCITQTNQANYTVSNPSGAGTPTPLGGTTNFISGLHPDVWDGNLSTPARADNPGFLVTDVNYPNAPVFVIVALGPSFIGSQPLTTLFPGVLGPSTRGNACIDFVTGVTMFGISGSTGMFQMTMNLDAGTRAIIQSYSAPNTSFDFWYQGFVLDAPTMSVLATGCGVQHM